MNVRHNFLAVALSSIILAALPACESTSRQSTQPSSTSQAVTLADENKTHAIPPATRDMLSELAKGHSDKVQLAWFATSFLKKLDPPVKQFASHMGSEHKELLSRLHAWAKKHDVSLKFEFGDDIFGIARKDMEKTQGNEVQAAGGEDFQRLFLILMSVDHLTQISFIKAMQETNPDPDLAAYLKDSLATYERDREQIKDFLKHYKYEDNAKR